MNSQTEQTPGLPLPQPAIQPAQVSAGFQAGNFAVQPLPGVAQNPVPSVASQQSSPASTSVTESEESLADTEWAGKARDITAQYKHDPYLQSRELSKLKAQYMKARYNKDIKVSEDRS